MIDGMKDQNKPFGTCLPTKPNMFLIQFCRGLSHNWLSKQMTQLLRKLVLKTSSLPLDLDLDGVYLRCYLKDNVSERNFVFMPWRYDVIERQQMLECLPTDGVFIDIGANIGIYSTIAANHLSASGTVIGIEPNPPVFDRLVFNLNATIAKRKNMPSIITLMLGITDSTSELELYLDDENLGASSIITNKSQSIKIPCDTLLNVIKKQKLTKVNVIKCDIEGAEDKALIPFLTEAPVSLLPNCIIFENNQQHWQDNLLKTLEETDYKLFAQTRLNLIYKLNKDLK
jgi:FkbM family methyltransferase